MYLSIYFILQIWHHVTSSSSPKLKLSWKVNVLNQFRTLRQPRQCNSKVSSKRTSNYVLESGKNDGIRVLKVRKDIFTRTNFNLYLTILHFVLFKHSPYFLITARNCTRIVRLYNNFYKTSGVFNYSPLMICRIKMKLTFSL